MAPYESQGWAGSVSGSFWKWLTGKNVWLEPSTILTSLSGFDRPGDRICVLVGSHDKWMDLTMVRRQVREFREAVNHSKQELTSRVDDGVQGRDLKMKAEVQLPGVDIECQENVRLVVVQDAGHHVQNDVQREVAAEALRRWIEQL